jgi:hypothetical protein
MMPGISFCEAVLREYINTAVFRTQLQKGLASHSPYNMVRYVKNRPQRTGQSSDYAAITSANYFEDTNFLV